MVALSTSFAATLRRRLPLLAALALLLPLVAIQTPAQAQPGVPATLTIQAAPLTLIANGTDTATITATVRDSGNNGVAGIEVSFFVDPATLGTLSAPTATTNASGQAQVTLTTTNVSGRAEVIASTESGLADTVFLQIGSATPVVNGLDLTANPTTILGNGSSPTTLTARVTTNSTPTPGVTVNFFVQEEGRSSFILFNSDVSDASGDASVTFTSGVGGSTLLKAVVSGGTAEDTVTITVTPVAATVVVTAAPGVILPNGASTATITATLTQAGGQPVVGQEVSFATSLGALSAATATTNASGVATVTLTANAAGTATVTVTAPSGAQGSTSVIVTATVPVFTAPQAGGFINARRPTIQGTLAAAVGATVRVFRGATTLCTATVQAGGAWSCTPASDLPEGAVTVQAEQVDGQGRPLTAAATLSFTVDVIAPPAPTIVEPTNNALVGPFPTIRGTAGANERVEVTVDQDGNAVTTGDRVVYQIQADASGNWSVSLRTATPVSGTLSRFGLPPGARATISARATDAAGNQGAQATLQVNVRYRIYLPLIRR